MKNNNETLTLNLTQPDRPLPESWRRAALDIVRTKVHPALRKLGENQSVTVAGNRAKSPQLEVKRLPAKSSPWLARVVMNAETMMYVARRAIRVIHGGEAYYASI